MLLVLASENLHSLGNLLATRRWSRHTLELTNRLGGKPIDGRFSLLHSRNSRSELLVDVSLLFVGCVLYNLSFSCLFGCGLFFFISLGGFLFDDFDELLGLFLFNLNNLLCLLELFLEVVDSGSGVSHD